MSAKLVRKFYNFLYNYVEIFLNLEDGYDQIIAFGNGLALGFDN